MADVEKVVLHDASGNQLRLGSVELQANDPFIKPTLGTSAVGQITRHGVVFPAVEQAGQNYQCHYCRITKTLHLTYVGAETEDDANWMSDDVADGQCETGGVADVSP